MKKTMTMLLIAALAPVLCLAQEKPATPAPTPSKYQDLHARLAATQTLDAVATLEKELAANLESFTPGERNKLILSLHSAYNHCVVHGLVVGGNWPLDVLPKYIADWDNSLCTAVVMYYSHWISLPALTATQVALKKAKTPAEIDAAIAGYFSKNLLPERLQATADSRALNPILLISVLRVESARAGHPEAINYALLSYRMVGMESEKSLNVAVGNVAAAIKAKDFNLTRANAWIEGQNTGIPVVALTEQEKALPAAIQAATLPDYLPVSLDAAKEKYRAAKTPAELNAAIYLVADALKAQDLNLARANAWIKSQKDGTPFDLK